MIATVFWRAYLSVLAVGALGGCFSPAFESGQLACDETERCPPGFECDPISQRCVRPGDQMVDAAVDEPDADPNAPDAEPNAADADPIRPDAGAIAIRQNIFGPAVTGVDFPGQWQADPGAGGTGSDLCTGGTGVEPAMVTGTVDQDLFKFRVFGTVDCTIGSNLPSGDYDVTLLMGELFFGPGCPGGGGVGDRVFDVLIEGATVEQNIDVFAEGGCVNSAATTAGVPVTRTYRVTVTDGAVDISLPGGQVSAIQVVSD